MTTGETCKAQFIPGGSSRYLKWNDTTYVIVTWTRLDSIIAVIATPGGVTRVQVHDTADVLRREFIARDTTISGTFSRFELVFVDSVYELRTSITSVADSLGRLDSTMQWRWGTWLPAWKTNVLDAEYVHYSDSTSWLPTWADINAKGYATSGGATTYRYGSGPPSSDALFNNGDHYWDYTNLFMYHKAAGIWRQDP